MITKNINSKYRWQISMVNIDSTNKRKLKKCMSYKYFMFINYFNDLFYYL